MNKYAIVCKAQTVHEEIEFSLKNTQYLFCFLRSKDYAINSNACFFVKETNHQALMNLFMYS